jgi:ADP-heptose:LPS heptosyltransferase
VTAPPSPRWAGRLRRRVNRWFYRRLFGLYRAAFPTPRWTGSIPVSARRRILVVRHDRVGDLVVTTPLLSFLKESAPDSEIDVLASPSNAQLLRGDDRVRRVYTNDHTWRGWLRVLPQLRRRRYGAILSPITLKGLREGLTASLIAHRDTYKVSSWRPVRYQGLFTAVVRLPPSATHMADQVLSVGHAAFGIPRHAAAARPRQYPMRIAVDARAAATVAAWLSERRVGRFVAVNVSSAVAERDWTPGHCAEFLTLLLARHPDLTVILTPAPGRERPTAEVARRSADPRVLVAPALPLLELAALVQLADAVVSPSTALVHLASALHRPVVALYAPVLPTDVALWLPRGVPYRSVASKLGGSVSDIAVTHMADAFDELRAASGGGDASRAAPVVAPQRAAPPIPGR